MQDLIAAYSTFVHGLPQVAQPIMQAFTPSLPVWTAIAIYERHWIAKHGKRPAARKVGGWLVVPVAVAFGYLRTAYPQVRAVLDWPDRHWPAWHLHWWQFIIGCLVAGYVAKLPAALYAAVVLRSRPPRNENGFDFPPGWEGMSRRINWHSEWEED